MFRCNYSFLAAAAASGAAAAAATPAAKPSKMQTLHKILTGEVAFKSKALVKECNVAAVFGDNWNTELAAYSKSLPEAEKKVLDRQVSRLNLTRYTTRELSCFAGNGAEQVDAAAKAYNVSQGAQMLAKEGDSKFTEFVNAEAAVANWSAEQTSKYIADVKATKK